MFVALVACSSKSAPTTVASGSSATPSDAAIAIPSDAAIATPSDAANATPSDAAIANATPSDAITNSSFVIPASTKQLVTATTANWKASNAELRLWKRDGAGWKQVGEPWRGVVGVSGTGWGSGLHGRGAPAGREGPIKHEGDGKSPAGVFDLTSSFGYANAPPKGTKVGYQQVDANWKCVDDPASREYNRILDARTTTIDWKSAEEMRRPDPLYTWVVEVAHNASHTPKDGSCIFLHVWSGPDSHTVGCTAMEEPRLASLIATLSPADHPALVLLPRGEYDALAAAWNLPRASP